jgi:hypothetical protein
MSELLTVDESIAKNTQAILSALIEREQFSRLGEMLESTIAQFLDDDESARNFAIVFVAELQMRSDQ